MDNLAVRLQVLGAAEPSTQALADIAAQSLNQPSVRVLSAEAAPIGMPMLNMTTGGLWRVHGVAEGHERSETFSVVAKLLQSPLLWSGIDQVPPHMRDDLFRHYPWRTEATVYESELSAVLPDGGRMPQVYAIHELDEQRTAIWMEDVVSSVSPWTDEMFTTAANWLGRLSGSTAARDAAPALDAQRCSEKLRFYVASVGTMANMPALRSEELWGGCRPLLPPQHRRPCSACGL